MFLDEHLTLNDKCFDKVIEEIKFVSNTGITICDMEV